MIRRVGKLILLMEVKNCINSDLFEVCALIVSQPLFFVISLCYIIIYDIFDCLISNQMIIILSMLITRMCPGLVQLSSSSVRAPPLL